VFVEDFLQICANICSRKLLVVAKESKNVQPGNASQKGLMFLEISHTQPVLRHLVSSLSVF
jgi:hypothetical protein